MKNIFIFNIQYTHVSLLVYKAFYKIRLKQIIILSKRETYLLLGDFERFDIVSHDAHLILKSCQFSIQTPAYIYCTFLTVLFYMYGTLINS